VSNTSLANPCEPLRYELFFRSLFHPGRSYAFPCDASGHVDMDALSETARQNYLYARTVIGREYSVPAVVDNSLDAGRV
jgi:hypothetical protein